MEAHLAFWPLPNVWLGVSVENQHFADERIPLLLQTPAAVRFVSAEPLLAPIDFTLRGANIPEWDEDWHYNVLSGEEWAGPRDDNSELSQHLDWLIVGGESGPKARPTDLAWIRSIVQQCRDASVPCFVKQLGANPVVTEDTCSLERAIREGGYVLRSRKGGDMTEWPSDVRVRQFPGQPT